MAQKRALQWRKIPVSLAELCLDTTLRCGQSFRYVPSPIVPFFSLLIMDLDGESLKTMSGLALFTDV